MKKLDLSKFEFDPEDQAEVLSRLSVLFPNSEFTGHDGVIDVQLGTKDQWLDILQAGHDQMLRTKYEKDNRELRTRLYQRLLG